jgi:glycosyltransferase involved in cell wall biosynthesis
VLRVTRGLIAPAYLISVIVCTYNRAAKLPQCLDSIMKAAQMFEGDCEVLCIDNNSTDGTRTVLAKMASQPSTPLTYLFEREQGASKARNTGIRHARGKFIAITDDDCIVDQNWLRAMIDDFETDPTLALLGGRVELSDPNDLPMSVRTLRERREVTLTDVLTLIPGCNIAVRRSVLDDVGLFDVNLGPGTAVGVAEDLDLIFRVYAAGYRIVYNPNALVLHAHGRRGAAARRQLEKAYLRGRGGFYLKHILKGDRQAMRLAYWEFGNLLKNIFKEAIGRRYARQDAEALRYLLGGAFLHLRMQLREVTRSSTKSASLR